MKFLVTCPINLTEVLQGGPKVRDTWFFLKILKMKPIKNPIFLAFVHLDVGDLTSDFQVPCSKIVAVINNFVILVMYTEKLATKN